MCLHTTGDSLPLARVQGVLRVGLVVGLHLGLAQGQVLLLDGRELGLEPVRFVVMG